MTTMAIGIIQRIQEFFTTATEPLRQRARVYTQRFKGIWRPPIEDWGRPDYAYWRRAYRAGVRGMEYSALFLRPVIDKLAVWSLGRLPDWQCDSDIAKAALDDWFRQYHERILTAAITSMKVGDAFLVINPDLTPTLVSAELVDPIVADDDYSNVIGWRITQNLAHPETTAQMIIVDEYYIDRRVHTVIRDGAADQTTTFRNVIGIIPVIHIANMPDEGGRFGYPEGEAPQNLLYRYNDVIQAAFEGNILQGRPTPVASFDEEDDLNDFWETYGQRQTQTLPDGTTKEYWRLNVDLSEIFTLTRGKFEYAQPGQFAGDVEIILGLAFYLALEYWQMPEFVFGNAISSSQASAETQMPVWEKTIQGRQVGQSVWMIQLARVVLAYTAYIRPGIAADQNPTPLFPPLTQDGKLTLDTLKWALMNGLINDRLALAMAPVEISDVDQAIKDGATQRDERREAMVAEAAALDDAAFERNRNQAISDEEQE